MSEKHGLQSCMYSRHWCKTKVPTREDYGKMKVEAAEFWNFFEFLPKEKIKKKKELLDRKNKAHGQQLQQNEVSLWAPKYTYNSGNNKAFATTRPVDYQRHWGRKYREARGWTGEFPK